MRYTIFVLGAAVFLFTILTGGHIVAQTNTSTPTVSPTNSPTPSPTTSIPNQAPNTGFGAGL